MWLCTCRALVSCRCTDQWTAVIPSTSPRAGSAPFSNSSLMWLGLPWKAAHISAVIMAPSRELTLSPGTCNSWVRAVYSLDVVVTMVSLKCHMIMSNLKNNIQLTTVMCILTYSNLLGQLANILLDECHTDAHTHIIIRQPFLLSTFVKFYTCQTTINWDRLLLRFQKLQICLSTLT